MKYFLIAGEASGDLHASNLMAQLKENDSQADFMFFGGDLMQAQGGVLLKHYREMAYMGLFEVIANMGKVNANFKLCREKLLEYKPDVLILVDYPGFNLRMAKFAHENGIKTVYYISPKIWAWKKNRVYKVKKYIDKMFVIFPFETDFYKQYDYQVEYVGNPLIDAMRQKEAEIVDKQTFMTENSIDKQVIALVPGSRRSEIKYILPEMLKVTQHFMQYQFVVCGAPGIDKEYYDNFLKDYDYVKIIFNQTYTVVKHAVAAVVASGTATLETAFLNTPQAVCYKFMPLSYAVASPFVKVKYFSLVNIILNKPAVKEILQKNLATKITEELRSILFNDLYCERMLKNYQQIRSILGSNSASQATAKRIVEIFKPKN